MILESRRSVDCQGLPFQYAASASMRMTQDFLNSEVQHSTFQFSATTQQTSEDRRNERKSFPQSDVRGMS